MPHCTDREQLSPQDASAAGSASCTGASEPLSASVTTPEASVCISACQPGSAPTAHVWRSCSSGSHGTSSDEAAHCSSKKSLSMKSGVYPVSSSHVCPGASRGAATGACGASGSPSLRLARVQARHVSASNSGIPTLCRRHRPVAPTVRCRSRSLRSAVWT